ncbi:hypothetical protein [Streptomyces globisporus]|uniref:hypothetical protein n=1 Tax=Streptomyces globisporus TaxID=1908 RepID=UPI000B301DE0|nr:hypothetical protein [Streptomyces globisporus]
MSGHFTDRDERMWQRRAEEWAARPLRLGAWLRRLRPAPAERGTPHRTPAYDPT